MSIRNVVHTENIKRAAAVSLALILTACGGGGGGGGDDSAGGEGNNGGGSTVNTPGSEIDDDRIATLNAQYGPILYFHPAEQYLPSSVEWYAAQNELAGSDDSLKCDSATPCERFDITQPGDTRQELLDRLVTTVNDNSAITNLWLETTDATRSGDLATAKSYVHVLDLGSVTDIQYWFFYPFNGPGRARVQFGEIHDETTTLGELGEHYGDWEAVILRFDDTTDELLGAFMSAHQDFTWYPAESLEIVDGHVAVFASLNGHAIYSSDVPNKFDERVVHEYAGWRNQCIGGELWGNCIGVRTDVGIGTLDVDLLNTTARGPSFNAYENTQLVAKDGEPVPGEEWIDLDIHWGQQRANPLSRNEVLNIMEDQAGLLTLVTVTGALAACAPPVSLIPVVGQALCLAYPLSIGPALIYAYEEGTDKINDAIGDEVISNGPMTPGAKGHEYIYLSCPKENKPGVLCPEDSAIQEEYTVTPQWHGAGYNWTGDLNGDGRKEIISAYTNNVRVKWWDPNLNQFTSSEYTVEGTGANSANDPQYNWVGDYDGDGRDEIIIASFNEIYVKRYVDIGSGGAFETQIYTLPAANYNGSPYNWTGDLNGDGQDEIISASGTTLWVKWYLKFDVDDAGDLVVDETGAPVVIDRIIQSNYTTGGDWGSYLWTWVGDIDGDGKDEIVTASNSNIFVRRFTDTETGGEFALTAYTVPADQWGTGGYSWLGDIDGDGKDEIVSASGDNYYTKSFTGTGFEVGHITYPGSRYGSPAYTWMGDITGNGKNELLSASNSTVWVKRFASISPTAAP